MRKKKRSKNLEILKKMPPLYHTLPNHKFETQKSELMNWVLNQPEILNWLVGYLKDTNYIEYNNLTGQWTGIEHQEKCPHDFKDWDECPDCCH